jgi:hypothetical protein
VPQEREEGGVPPQDRIADRKMIASEHIEMLICYVYNARSLFEEVNSARSGRSRGMAGLDVVVFLRCAYLARFHTV